MMLAQIFQSKNVVKKFGSKNFAPKKFWSENIFGAKKRMFWSKINFGPKNLPKKSFDPKRIFGPNKF